MAQSKNNQLLSAIRSFFDVNDELRNDLNKYCIESCNKNLDEALILWAAMTTESKYYDEALAYYKDLNKGPHSITEMIEMYDFIDDMAYLLN